MTGCVGGGGGGGEEGERGGGGGGGGGPERKCRSSFTETNVMQCSSD